MDLKGNLLLPPAKPTAAASTLAEQEAVHCTTLTENVGNIKIYNVSKKYYWSIKNSTAKLFSALVTSGPTALQQQQQQQHFILI